MREIWYSDEFKIEDHLEQPAPYLKIVFDNPRRESKIIEENEAQLIRKILNAWDNRI